MKKYVSLLAVLVLLVCAFAFFGKQNQEQTDPNLFVLEDMNLTAENVSPYSGRYLEAGEEETVSGVYAMKITNTGKQTIREAQLVFSDGSQELFFFLEMLSPGQSVTVAEQEKLPAGEEAPVFVDGKVTVLEKELEKPDCVQVATGANGAMTVTNTTKEPLPLVRVFYRDTDGAGNQLGGLCRSALIDGLEPGASVEPEAEGWTEGCAVITVLVVNE